MKVVYLADAPYIHTRRWLAHFVERGIDCEVISFRPADIEGARVHHVDGSEPLGKARYLIHARRVKQLVQDLKPDLVHAMHLTSYGFLGALSSVRPLIISVWGTDILEAPNLTPFHRWLTRYSLARADAITATGLHLATETTRFTPRGTRVTSIPYGVDLQRFQPVERPVSQRVTIGTASRFSPEKGLRYLLEAFAQLRQRFGDRVALRIAGDGPERGKLDALVERLGIAGQTELAGWVEHAELPAFLQSLDVFVLPSTYEGFGVAAVEASAMALPVVASRVYGLPDVVKEGVTGFLVPAKNSVALAQAIGRLVEDPDLRVALGKAGRQYVAERYDWRENAAQMDRLYEKVLSGRGAPVPVWT